MTSQILVAGGAGYIGSVLVRELLDRGYAVKVFDRMFFGREGLEEVKDRLEIVVGDVRTLDRGVLRDVSGVINLAGLSNDPTAEYNPKANYQMNTEAAERLAQLCKESGVARHLFASSCSVYDVGVHDEDEDVILDEGAPVRPKAAYSQSKFEAEQALLSMVDDSFCPVILRKGTVYGFSPRMRYDLVVNTLVKDAVRNGAMTIYYGGEMWRPLVDVRDVAKAYIACLEAPEEKVRGQIFNVAYGNFRISEVALRVQLALKERGIEAEILADYVYKGVRSYRVSTDRLVAALNLQPSISIEESVKDMTQRIARYGFTDFDHPRYHNIQWMKLLEEADGIIRVTGSVFDAPPHRGAGSRGPDGKLQSKDGESLRSF